MDWGLETELGCSVAETALEWDSGKEAGEFVLAADHSKELGHLGIVETPYLPSLRQRYLFIGVQDYSHIGGLLRILVLTQLGYRSLILMIWEGIVDYPHF